MVPIKKNFFKKKKKAEKDFAFCLLGTMVSVLNHFSCVWLFATLWTIARQAPLSIGFSRQEYWSGLPCSPLGHLPNPGIKPTVAYVSCIGRQVLYHWYHVGSPEWCPIHCILHCRVKRVMTGKKWANIEIRVMLHLTPSRCRFYSTNSYSTILGSQAQPVCVCVCVCVCVYVHDHKRCIISSLSKWRLQSFPWPWQPFQMFTEALLSAAHLSAFISHFLLPLCLPCQPAFSFSEATNSFLPQDLCTYRLGWSPPRTSHSGFLLMTRISESLTRTASWPVTLPPPSLAHWTVSRSL